MNSCTAIPLHSSWHGDSRPTPAQMRDAEYDTRADGQPSRKLVVCAAPRASSKRLARLLFGAGIGVPLEYFNTTTAPPLMARWQVRRQDYLEALFQRRTVNGIFATNLQFPQIRSWSSVQDFARLLEGATVIHLVREDKLAQAASLATCMVTGRWGFEEKVEEKKYGTWRLKMAARKAMRIIAEDEGLWRDWFAAQQISPVRLATEQVNRHDLAVVEDIAARLGVTMDLQSAQRMLELDRAPYGGDQQLKSTLKAIVNELAARG